MIVRIVRMTFRYEKVEDFLAIFNASKSKIRHFEGCLHLELWRDADNSNVLTTYSHWKNEECLENYRHSELFKSTWSQTRVLFAEKAWAFSNEVISEVD